jgi:hypothetical protein
MAASCHRPSAYQPVAGGRQAIPELVEAVRQISLEVRNRLAGHASRSLVSSNPLVGFHTSRFAMSNGFALAMELLPSPVGPRPELNNPTLRSGAMTAPSPLLRVAPPLRPASLLSSSQGPPAWISPSHQGDRFPRCAQKPGSKSRRLHAGGRPGSNQAFPRLIPD